MGCGQGSACTQATAEPRAVRAALPWTSRGTRAAGRFQGPDTGSTPAARFWARKLSAHQRAGGTSHPAIRRDTGEWAAGKEGGPSRAGRKLGAPAMPSQEDRPRPAGQTPAHSPTAQRSANRSSPSSAWIRSFRLFLAAALFSTALNKHGERGLREPAPSCTSLS